MKNFKVTSRRKHLHKDLKYKCGGIFEVAKNLTWGDGGGGGEEISFKRPGSLHIEQSTYPNVLPTTKTSCSLLGIPVLQDVKLIS